MQNNNEAKQLDTNTGIAFNNTDPMAASSPQLKGTLNVEGKVYKISIWKNISKAGNDYLKIKLSPQTSVSK